MYGKLPSEILSNVGFQGCLASIELNGEAADPIHNALVPSEYVSSGCEGELTLIIARSIILKYEMISTFFTTDFYSFVLEKLELTVTHKNKTVSSLGFKTGLTPPPPPNGKI